MSIIHEGYVVQTPADDWADRQREVILSLTCSYCGCLVSQYMAERHRARCAE